ncbi:MAG: response regulator transcription factor [Dehalococcoidia bacterium]|nr:response regulator transcription factor [Dehalococcoidia bacterium]
MDNIRILIADDHTLFRGGLKALLASLPNAEIVGEAADGEEAIAFAAQLQPDVILMDIQMPRVNGIEAARRILESTPHVGVLMLTMFEDDDSVFSAMRAGARGYVLKGASQGELIRAIEAVASGEALFGPGVAERLLTYLGTPRPRLRERTFPELTEREREVLNLIAAGNNNATIANKLVLSPKTVRNHISNIFSKLQVADRAEAIIRAREAGMGR